jgi:hypothetical protein
LGLQFVPPAILHAVAAQSISKEGDLPIDSILLESPFIQNPNNNILNYKGKKKINRINEKI